MQPSATAPQQNPDVPADSTMRGIERLIVWIGSRTSLVIHSLIFVVFFAVSIFKWVPWDLMLLVLTTLVSLEAIYLAIFIQMTVNRQSQSLKEVEEDVGDIQEDIEELGENVEELGENVEELGENVEGLKEDVEDIQEDIEDLGEDLKEDAEEDQQDHVEPGDAEQHKKTQAEILEALTNDVRAILTSLESMKGR
jgi:uncharacterized protein YoxC